MQACSRSLHRSLASVVFKHWWHFSYTAAIIVSLSCLSRQVCVSIVSVCTCFVWIHLHITVVGSHRMWKSTSPQLGVITSSRFHSFVSSTCHGSETDTGLHSRQSAGVSAQVVACRSLWNAGSFFEPEGGGGEGPGGACRHGAVAPQPVPSPLLFDLFSHLHTCHVKFYITIVMNLCCCSHSQIFLHLSSFVMCGGIAGSCVQLLLVFYS